MLPPQGGFLHLCSRVLIQLVIVIEMVKIQCCLLFCVSIVETKSCVSSILSGGGKVFFWLVGFFQLLQVLLKKS